MATEFQKDIRRINLMLASERMLDALRWRTNSTNCDGEDLEPDEHEAFDRLQAATADARELAEKVDESAIAVAKSVALVTGIEYIPEADAFINMDKFRAQLAIPELERAVLEAATSYVAAKRLVRRDPPWSEVELEPSLLQAFFSAEGVLFEAVDALQNARQQKPDDTTI